MVALVLVLMAAAWIFKSQLGKSVVLVLGVLSLAFLAAMGASGGLLWGLCVASVVMASFSLMRRTF